MFRFMYIIQRRTLDSNIRFLQTIASDSESLAVSFFTNSCGLSLESAVKASKLVKIESTKRPDSVIELFKSHGFTKTHIASLISKHPSMILTDPEKILRPKIEYFKSLGLVGPDLPKILCSNKDIFLTSLKRQIIPTLDFLKGFVQTNERLIYALKQSSRVVGCNVGKVMKPNISTLRAHGVSEAHISKLMIMQPQSLMLRVDLFDEVASRIRQMGFNPTSRSFILAIRSMSMISKANWEKKKELLMKLGWSENEFNFAFKVQPMCMMCSEKKISGVMEFLVNNMGLKPSDIARCPNIFLTSLEKRIIPRCSLLQALISKGLIEKDVNVVWVLNSDKKRFEKKFVDPFMERAPEVFAAYQIDMGLQAFNNALEDGNRKMET